MLSVLYKRILCCLVCLSLSNGVLLVGQLIAWTGMTAERSPSGGYVAAWVETVNSADLCNICVVVSELGQSESEEGMLRETLRAMKVLESEDSGGSSSLKRPLAAFGSLRIASLAVPLGLDRTVEVRPPRVAA